MTDSKRTQFNYLLNAMELAGQHADPASQDFYGKREALFRYVRRLEALAEPGTMPARLKLLEDRVSALEQKGLMFQPFGVGSR